MWTDSDSYDFAWEVVLCEAVGVAGALVEAGADVDGVWYEDWA